MNDGAQTREGPRITIETHMIAMPPNPPETSKEDGRTGPLVVPFNNSCV